MEQIMNFLVPIILGMLASSGFWAYMERRTQKRALQTKLLVGIAHDRILESALRYITRRWITQDEYENLFNYLYEPYLELGGNGSVKRIMEEVNKLPIRKDKFLSETTGETIP